MVKGEETEEETIRLNRRTARRGSSNRQGVGGKLTDRCGTKML